MIEESPQESFSELQQLYSEITLIRYRGVVIPDERSSALLEQLGWEITIATLRTNLSLEITEGDLGQLTKLALHRGLDFEDFCSLVQWSTSTIEKEQGE